MEETKGDEGTQDGCGERGQSLPHHTLGSVTGTRATETSKSRWEDVEAHAQNLDTELLEAVKTYCARQPGDGRVPGGDDDDAEAKAAWKLIAKRCFFVDLDNEGGADELDKCSLDSWYRLPKTRYLQQISEQDWIPSMRRLYQALERSGCLAGNITPGTHREQVALCETLIGLGATPLVILLRTGLIGLDFLTRNGAWKKHFQQGERLPKEIARLQRHCGKPDVAGTDGIIGEYRGKRGWETWNEFKPIHMVAGPTKINIHRKDAVDKLREAFGQIRAAVEDNNQARQHYPIILLAGAPGIGKSHFIHLAGKVLMSDISKSQHVIEIRLRISEPKTTLREHELVTEAMIATRIFVQCFMGGDFDSMLRDHFPVAQSLTIPHVLRLVAKHLCPTDKTPVVVLSVDEAQNFKRGEQSLLPDLMVDLGDAMRTASFPVVCLVAGLTPQKMGESVKASSHPSMLLPLEWFDYGQRRDFFEEIATLEASDVWFVVGDTPKDVLKTKLGQLNKLMDVPLFKNLISDTGGQPRMLIFLVEIIVAFLVDKPVADLGQLNAVKARKQLRIKLRDKYRENATCAAMGDVFSPTELLRIIAAAVGNVALDRRDVFLQEKGRAAYTVAQLESNGVFTCPSHPIHGDKVVVQLPFLLVQRWLESIPRKEDAYPEAYGLAAQHFHWTMRQWMRQEIEAFSPSTSSSTLWEATGAMYTCLRANALCIMQQKNAVEMSMSEFYQGALLSSKLMNLDRDYNLRVGPLWFMRVHEKIQGNCDKLTVWGSEGGRCFNWKSDQRFDQVFINGENGPGFDILAVREIVCEVCPDISSMLSSDRIDVCLFQPQVRAINGPTSAHSEGAGMGGEDVGMGAGADMGAGSDSGASPSSPATIIELDQRKAHAKTTAVNWSKIAKGLAMANLVVKKDTPIVVELYSTSQCGCTFKNNDELQNKWDEAWTKYVNDRHDKWDTWKRYEQEMGVWSTHPDVASKPTKPKFRKPSSREPWRESLPLIMLVAGQACRQYFGPTMADRPMLRACNFPQGSTSD